jgi:hypothetical protein
MGLISHIESPSPSSQLCNCATPICLHFDPTKVYGAVSGANSAGGARAAGRRRAQGEVLITQEGSGGPGARRRGRREGSVLLEVSQLKAWEGGVVREPPYIHVVGIAEMTAKSVPRADQTASSGSAEVQVKSE